MDSNAAEPGDDKTYEAQYHPKAELGNIYAVGSNEKQTKYNNADNVSRIDRSDISPRDSQMVQESQMNHTGSGDNDYENTPLSGKNATSPPPKQPFRDQN